MSTVTLIQADARHIPLADKSVQCVITSPPYYGLRDYQTGRWEGGSEACDHIDRAASEAKNRLAGSHSSDITNRLLVEQTSNNRATVHYRDTCGKCGARRVDSQIGLEPTIEAYVARLVAVFREVKRILRDDGTCWVNLGDSYATQPAGNTKPRDEVGNGKGLFDIHPGKQEQYFESGKSKMDTSRLEGIAPKNLLGIPWRVAFALQADGWILRSEIIWAKPNPMPESVADRPTKSHEQIFLLAKRERYFYDAEGVREPGSRYGWNAQQFKGGDITRHHGNVNGGGGSPIDPSAGRNLRSVWTITPRPFAGAHFATFPAELVERCVKAGTSERGQCPSCGRAWERVVEREPGGATQGFRPDPRMACPTGKAIGSNTRGMPFRPALAEGFRQSCSCPPHEPVPQVVFDCFGGAGTVPMVASNLGRRGVMTELSPQYIEIARRRIERPHSKPERVAKEEHHPLFAGIEP